MPTAYDPARVRTAASLPWVAIFVLALALRALNVWALADTPLYRSPHGDGLVYLDWADEIRSGTGARGEPFYQAPLYAYGLALFRSTVGESLFALRLAQALLGAATAVLAGLATARLVGRRAGLATGLLLAIYAPSIWLDGLVQKSALVGALFAGALFVSTFDAARARLALGGIMGLLMLTRGEARLLALALGVWLASARELRGVAAYAAGLALALAPALARNVTVGGEWVLTTSQSGPNLYIGNAPGSNGTYAPLVPGRGDARYEREDARRLAERAKARPLTAREVSDHWRDLALEGVRADPRAALGRLAVKGALALNATELADTDDLEHAARSSPILRFAPGFACLAALAAAGGVLASRGDRSALRVPALLGLTQWAALVLFFVFARYRLPLAIALAPLAGLAVAAFQGASARRRVVAASAAALGLLLARAPLEAAAPENGLAAALVNEGNLLVDEDRAAEGLACGDEAVELVPNLFDAHRLRARAFLDLRQPGRAIPALERALELAPMDWQVRAWLGIALGDTGETGELARARDLLAGCALERPEALPIVSNAVQLSLALDRPAEAISLLRRRLDEAPDEGAVPFRLQLGWLLATARDDGLRGGEEALLVLAPLAETEASLDVRAAALAELGRFEEAIAAIDRALAVRGPRATAMRQRRAAYLGRRAWRE